MAVKVGINGFGRIGRQVLRAAKQQGVADIDFVAGRVVFPAARAAADPIVALDHDRTQAAIRKRDRAGESRYAATCDQYPKGQLGYIRSLELILRAQRDR